MKTGKKAILIGTFCLVMISMLFFPAASATTYCYGWYHVQNDVTGVWSYVKETSAVHAQSGNYMQKWNAILVASGTNNYTAEINLCWYQTDSTSQLFFTAAVQKQGVWQSDVTTQISTTNLDSNTIRICVGRNGTGSKVWMFYYSLDSGAHWTTMRTYDFGVVWSGDRYVTTFEDSVGAMTATSPPALAGQTTSMQYQLSGWNWYDTNLDTVLNSGQDPHITYGHTATSETGTFHT
ncbi:MAG: hypothetical protein NWE96_06535 [Candidatus Bathyarchaeota archaeon]|nr:hypothetical protein [Candidatus Bathyarchaeota archaeon]